MKTVRLALAAALLLSSAAACRTSGGSGDAVGALLNVGLAATAAGISRSQGGCYASCPPGTSCNPANGLCDPLPCRGQCSPTQRCDQSGPIERCVLDRPAQMQINQPLAPTPPSTPPSPPSSEPLLSPAPPPTP